MKTKAFQKKIWDYYKKEGRHELPWRKTRNPYKIIVSEIMLQQTQVDRVVPKYKNFLKQFPTVQSLARAPLQKVLEAWSGLGYNRRALYLKRAAEYVMNELGEKFPKSVEELEKLPGVGPYTARAHAIIVHNQPHALIETNIRAVYIHEFLSAKKKVSDKELLPLIEKTLSKDKSRDWFYALMDYGVYLKKMHPNPSRKSAHHTKQSKFEGSFRQIRAKVLRECTKGPVTKAALLCSKIGTDKLQLERAIRSLVKDGFITVSSKGRISIIIILIY